MGLHEKVVGIQRQLIQRRQFIVIRRLDGGGQINDIGFDQQVPLQNRIEDFDIQPLVCLGDRRFTLQIVTDKDHTQFAGLFVKGFSFTVGPDVPVQDKDMLVRCCLFNGAGLQDGSQAGIH